MHRGIGNVLPMLKKACYGAMLSAEPRIQEPYFEVTVKTEEDKRGDVYSCISSRRGRVISDEIDSGKMITIKGHMPVAESFGFATYLRDNTQGKAHPMTAFSHWETVDSDPYQEGTMANQIVKEVRQRKGLSETLPDPARYVDKL